MSSPNFRFKQFTVWHDRCAMKVGTDGVLLGAWCPISEFHSQHSIINILDIGTGSGLIALMLAQRITDTNNAFRIKGIDIDENAVTQAAENFVASPWAEYLKAEQMPFQSLPTDEKYDLIVSNPPYFVDSLKNPDHSRELARHADSLTYKDLLTTAVCHLTEHGQMALILPAEAESTLLDMVMSLPLRLTHLTRVYSKPGKPCKRILLCFHYDAHKGTGQATDASIDTFYIESPTSPRSEEYTNLMKDFYL